MIARALFAFALICTTAVHADAQSITDRLKKAAEKAGEVALTAGTLLPIDARKETEIGQGIAATVAGRYRMSNDSALNEYVNLVGLAVAGEAPRTDIAYRFAVLETPVVNAFAAPGGYIFITRGSLNLIESEAELAGVLAHELAHVNRKHVIEQIRKADVMRELREQSGIEGEKLDKLVGHGSNVMFTGLSRADEEQADSLALEYVSSVGYSTEGLKAFVTKLGANASETRLSELMSTHPRPSERLKNIDRMITRLGAAGEMLTDRYRSFMGGP
jgi:predicted Zn-dependent protease